MAAQLLAQSSRGLPPDSALQHDLDKVQYLLAALEGIPIAEPGDLDDLVWLRRHQRFLHTALASRAAFRRQKVVDLALWRAAARP